MEGSVHTGPVLDTSDTRMLKSSSFTNLLGIVLKAKPQFICKYLSQKTTTTTNKLAFKQLCKIYMNWNYKQQLACLRQHVLVHFSMCSCASACARALQHMPPAATSACICSPAIDASSSNVYQQTFTNKARLVHVVTGQKQKHVQTSAVWLYLLNITRQGIKYLKYNVFSSFLHKIIKWRVVTQPVSKIHWWGPWEENEFISTPCTRSFIKLFMFCWNNIFIKAESYQRCLHLSDVYFGVRAPLLLIWNLSLRRKKCFNLRVYE